MQPLRVWTTLALTVLLLVQFGCAAGSGGFPPRSESEAEQIRALEAEFAGAQFISDYYDAQKSPTPEARKTLRNRIVNGRMAIIDAHYRAFTRRFVNERNALDTGTDAAVIGLSTAGALINPSSTTQIISGIAATLTGSKASFDKHYYYEQTARALHAAMNAQRKVIRAQILAGLSLTDNDYPLARALSDLDEYYFAGTFLGGLQAIQKDASVKENKADNELSQYRESNYTDDDASRALRRFWLPDGEHIDAENQIAIQRWLQKNDLNGEPIPYFLHAEEFKTQRARCARELGLMV